jgi:Mg2+/citrate symporter
MLTYTRAYVFSVYVCGYTGRMCICLLLYIAYVSSMRRSRIRQHTSAYVSIRQHTSAYDYADVSSMRRSRIRQHTSYVRQLLYIAYMSAAIQGVCVYVCCYIGRICTCLLLYIAYMSSMLRSRIRQHTSAYVSIRQHTSYCCCI